MRFHLFLFITFFVQCVFSQNVTIKGVAPFYLGETIEVYETEDYLSYYEKILTRSTVKQDSTFSLSFKTDEVKKVVVRCDKNWSFLYIQPGGSYTVFFPEKDEYEPTRPTGNEVELIFVGLDSNDINYKILGFQRWLDYFAANTLYRVEKDSTNSDFAINVEKFKTEVEKYYENDSSQYLKTYIKFSIAFLENVQHAAERNKYEKYDFFIANQPVEYQNDIYMSYIKGFYRNLMPRLHSSINQEVYDGIIHASPTKIMVSLGKEYTLHRIQIREMIMLKMLTEEFHSGDYPQTNILTILDSVAERGRFVENRLIAKNLRSRLTELVPGMKAPEIVFSSPNLDTKTLSDFKGKYLYVHFCQPNTDQFKKDIILMKDIYKRYNGIVEFVSIYELSKDDSTNYQVNIPWNVYPISKTNSIWKNYKIKSYPHFVLLDVEGYIVQSPALKPTANGQYETIDKTFYLIKEAMNRRQ